MAIRFKSGADRYEALRSHRLRIRGEEGVSVAEPTALAGRGAWFTDHSGMPYSSEITQSQARDAWNTAWTQWVVPFVDKLKRRGESIPDEVTGFRVLRLESKKAYVEMNPRGPIVKMSGYQGRPGDPVEWDDIPEWESATPPEHEGHPAPWLEFMFRGGQHAMFWDLREEVHDWKSWPDEANKWLAEAYAVMLFSLQFGNLGNVATSLSKHDLAWTRAVDGRTWLKLLAACKQNDTTVSKILEECCTAETWQKQVNSWQSTSAFEKRAALLTEALECYEKGLYSATVCLLLSLVDGLIVGCLLPEYRAEIIQTNGKHTGRWKGWRTVRDVFTKAVDEQAKLRGPVAKIRAATLRHFLVQSRIQGHFDFGQEVSHAGRNPVMHGMSIGYGTKSNADRTFIALAAIHESMALIAPKP